MRIFVLAAMAAIVTTGALAQSATTITSPNGSRFVINASSYTGTPTSILGSANYFVGAGTQDYNFRYAFAYRQTGDTREYAVSAASGATFSNTTDSWTGVIPRNVMNAGANTLEFRVNHRIMDLTATTPLLVSMVTVRNISAERRGVVLFHYSDFDIPVVTGGTSLGDNIISNLVTPTGIITRQQDNTTTSNYAETVAFGATRFRHGLLYSSIFSNTVIDNLDNTTPLPTFNGDLGMGMQWEERFMDPGASTSYTVMTSLNSPVPEPASLAALALGVAALLRRRKSA